VIDSDEARWWRGVVLELLDLSAQRVRAGGYGLADGESGPGLATEGTSDRRMGLANPGSGARMRLGNPREALGADVSWTLRLRAEEAVDCDEQSDSPVQTGQVGEATGVATVDAT